MRENEEGRPRRGGAITLQDVAADAGVTKMTASFVLNGSRSGTRVSDATRKRIVEAAARLGYRPNAVARGLTRRRMDTLGVVPVIYGGLNLYFLELFNGILDQATAHQQRVTVLPLSGWTTGEEARLLQYCDGRIDGMILIAPAPMDPEFLQRLDHQTPLVTIHGADGIPNIPNLNTDDESGTYLTTRHLLESGHRRIAHMTGDMLTPSGRARLAGYRRALGEAGIDPDPDLVLYPGGYSESEGRSRTERLLEAMAGWAPDRRPTAICCANDATAIGCLKVLAEHGLRVPAEMSVTGFDDVLSTQVTDPPLTTVAQPFVKIGGHAAQSLLRKINCRLAGEPEDTVASERFPVSLVVRGSVLRPRLSHRAP